MVKCNRQLDDPVKVHHRLNYRNSWGFAARATAWRLSRRLSGVPISTRLTAPLKRKLRKYLPKQKRWALTAAQVRKAQRGVPRASARWAPLVNRYFTKYLKKVRGRRLSVIELRRLLWVIHYESSGNPRCVYMGHYGLFQCSLGHFCGRDWRRPVSQIATAAMLYARNGRSPWLATWGRACASAR